MSVSRRVIEAVREFMTAVVGRTETHICDDCGRIYNSAVDCRWCPCMFERDEWYEDSTYEPRPANWREVGF